MIGRRPPSAQRGIALVIVLCLVLLMSVLAVSHSRNAHIETMLAARQVETTAARFVAESAINLAILELLHADARDMPHPDGRLRELRLEDRDIILSVRGASGLVDINKAAEPLLKSVFAAAGAADDYASALAAAVVDWRDTDDLRHMDGAEIDDYVSAGMPWRPSNRPFSTVDELRFVLGVTPAIFREASPYLTVHSPGPTLDLDLAPDFLILAVTGSRLAVNEASNTARVRTGAYHINAAVRGSGSVLVSCEAVVLVTGSAEVPYSILEWRETSRLLGRQAEPEDI